MTTETKETTPVVFSVQTCNIRPKPKLYSMTITVQDVHTSLRSFPYPHRPGSHNEVVVYCLTPADMLTLSNKICEAAFSILTSQLATEEE